MKYFLLVCLLFTYSCKDSSDQGSDGKEANTETSTPVLPAPNPSPTPEPTPSPTPTPTPSPSNPTNSEAQMIEEFMELVNDHRNSIGLRPLTHDANMGKIAAKHSANMANGSVPFGHDGFSTRCSDSRKVMGGGNWCGENVAWGQKNVQAAFNSWMNSPGHRANIEKSSATHTGFGFKKNSSGTWYWTQIFLQVY